MEMKVSQAFAWDTFIFIHELEVYFRILRVEVQKLSFFSSKR